MSPWRVVVVSSVLVILAVAVLVCFSLPTLLVLAVIGNKDSEQANEKQSERNKQTN